MKSLKTLMICSFILLSGLVFSQEQNSVLWEISGNGLESPSYLFGTIHVKCPDDIKLSPEAQNALNASEQLVLEIDMDAPDFAAKMQSLSVNEGMKNISTELSDKDLSILNAFFTKHYRTDLSQLGIMKPFVLLSLMSMKGLECSQTGSYEEFLMGQAKEKQWEIRGLEQVEDQIKIFDSIAMEDQLSWLIEIAVDEESFKKEVQNIVEAYDSQDFETILKVMNENPQYQTLGYELFEKRNRNWIDDIAKFAKEKPSFFAVGAGHLGESYGVIQLLKEEGFTLTPVNNTIE